MGYIVYDKDTGKMEKWYKKEATAKRTVTQHNTTRNYESWIYRPDREWDYCSYRDYEGILMGLRGDAFKMWQFCDIKIS